MHSALELLHVAHHNNAMSSSTEDATPPHARVRRQLVLLSLLAWWIAVGVWHSVKPMPPGTNVATEAAAVPAEDVQFLYDLTYADAHGRPLREHSIFDEVARIIDGAQRFIVADFFLVNDLMGATSQTHRPLSREIAEALIARKKARPELAVLFITDPINEIYGGMSAPFLDAMRRAGIDVVLTDLTVLRDSNFVYSPLWRTFVQWWSNSKSGGLLPNPFTTEPAPVTLRSWLALLNFKANHRKLIVADRADSSLVALVTSANPHDASSAHSNVAVRFIGPLAEQIVRSEISIARFSGWQGTFPVRTMQADSSPRDHDAPQVQFLTEGAIREHPLEQIRACGPGDAVDIAVFYLSDRAIIEALLDAAARETTVRLILDPNRDAFGRRKDGVPNRPVANELVTRSNGKIQVRWYRTHGEQFHTKLVLIRRGDRLHASLGSANLTRRNLANYNLEANIAVTTSVDTPLAGEMLGYFERLWNSDGPPGTEFTASFETFKDDRRGRYWRYRLMEATGLSTF